MTLEELITALESHDRAKVVPHGFATPHSYRGDYSDLAFEPAANVTVGSMLDAARSAIGQTFQGWKGGDYTMADCTDCWLAEYGCCGETIGPLLLKLMLAETNRGCVCPGDCEGGPECLDDEGAPLEADRG